MSELTPEQKYYRTKRREVYLRWAVGVAAAIVVFLLIRGCNNQRAANEAYNAIKDTLQSVLADTARTNAIARSLRAENADLDLNIADLVEDLQLTKGALIDESDRADKLAVAYKRARAEKDTVQMLSNCDSLANQHWILLARQWKEDSIDTELHNAFRASIKNLTAQSDNFEKSYKKCLAAVTFASGELPKLEPRGQWFLTGGGFMAGPVFGGTGGFTHVTKKSLLLSAEGMLTNYGPGAMAKVGLLLGAKRR